MKEKTPLKKLKEGEMRDKPFLLSSSIDIVLNVLMSYRVISNDLNLKGFYLHSLLLLHKSWCNYGLGMNCQEIVNAMGYKGDMHSHMAIRLREMHNNGLIDVVGTGVNSSKLYAPTDYTIAVIEEHLSRFN